jgi:DNA adenine methylase
MNAVMGSSPADAGGSEEARPILKWAGGKRQLLPALRRFYPRRFRRYFEPFLGSAAVFLDLHNRGALPRGARLSDSSHDLVGCYTAVRDSVDAVIAALDELSDGHRRRGTAHYYDVRDHRFNPERRDRTAHAAGGYPPALAAMLIYLNRTGYNGLFRLNARGDFNVPAGRYDRPIICDAENLRRVATALARPGVSISVARFDDALAEARAGDFIYLDPPYAPTSRTASFTAYTEGGFSADDQVRLQALAVGLARRGCHILLSNSTAPEIRRLYADDRRARAAGLRTLTVPARRAINSRAAGRGAVLEYVITNIGVN